MSVSLYFGLPGCGKTTFLARRAIKESRKIERGKSPYTMVYGNVPLIGIKYYRYIPYDYLGKYQLYKALILIDEATIEQDSRDYKSFKQEKKEFFLLHRHYRCDIILYTQQWDGIDKKIRVITDKVYYIYKTRLTGKYLSRYYRVPYGIIIPDKKDDTEKLGEIVQGYCKPNFFIRLFTPPVFRPFWYKYFDSFDAPQLPEIPDYSDTLT